MRMESKKLPRCSRKLLAGTAVLLFSLCFSLTAFSQTDAPQESRVERSGDELQIVYAFDLPGTEDSSRIDDTLLEKTRETVLHEKNSWPQSYPVESVGAAEELLGIDFLIGEPEAGYASIPGRSDTLRVQATAAGKIAGTTYTVYRTYEGYGVTIVADTIWDGSVSRQKKYSFPFDRDRYTVEEIPLEMPSGGTVTAYAVTDQEGAIAGQYAMFHQGATTYLVYLLPYGQPPAEETPGSTIQAVLRDWAPGI